MMEELVNEYTNHFEIPDNVLQDWQSIVDLIAHIGGARVGLIMKVVNKEIEVLVASNSTDNPYMVGNKEHLINSGLYCEKVILEKEKLFVANALKSPEWKNNPDIKHNMLCYLGFPIMLPNDKPFGTICILDDKENDYSSEMVILMEKMRDLIEAHIKLLYLSFHDQLTGLYNRTFLNIKTTEVKESVKRYKMPISMLVLDIDHFKKVNDTFGHVKGDEVLKIIAQIITSSLRSFDIAARYGGEEFIVLMPNTSIGDAVLVAERIRTKVANNQCLAYGKVTVSIGASEYICNEALDDWFKRADAALYEAKNGGRNQVIAYDIQDSIPAAYVHLEWKNEWNCGNEQIDKEHQKMVELGNHLINMSLSDKGFDKIMVQLELLLNHISYHFYNEEKFLSEIGYPNYEEHTKIHKDLVFKALKLKESCINNKIKPADFFSFVVDDIVIGHMEQEDINFFPYIKSHR
ncbi:MAG: hypothetical protein H6Q64_898 [Firmicutes bacterium]|nr:hypothetical protein [Bacillota bacterium]